ncbi:unnamed protein product [Arabis nemorensis]|uniref:Uncharacterized protein n=1 Tax=Arabis nemorensis TaxID=586526 RepID=A0A565CDV0_9BRAS|nr:unnamed protein product [Arabis nemorensis]
MAFPATSAKELTSEGFSYRVPKISDPALFQGRSFVSFSVVVLQGFEEIGSDIINEQLVELDQNPSVVANDLVSAFSPSTDCVLGGGLEQWICLVWAALATADGLASAMVENSELRSSLFIYLSSLICYGLHCGPNIIL